MADIKKFLDNAGVSTLWGQIATEIQSKVNVEKTRAEQAEAALQTAINNEATTARAAEKANATAAANAKSVADAAKSLAETNKASLAKIQGSDTDKSARAIAAEEVAKIVASADADFDTLKEIADWISTHADGVSSMNTAIQGNTTAINDLKTLVGNTAVATQIANAIEAANHATAGDLNAAITRIGTLEGWKTSLAGTGSRLITEAEITKLGKLVMADDGSVSMSGSIAAGNVQGLTDAIDGRIATQVVALSAEEIVAACK